MSAGRKPAPAALKLLKGRTGDTDSGGRKVIKLPFRRLPPEKPAGLTAAAAAHWDAIVPELSRMQLLKTIDVGAMTILCETWSRWKAAEELLRDSTLLVASAFNGVVRHPAIAIADAAAKEYRAWCSEFGLTPSAEGRLRPKEADGGEGNPFE